MFTKPCSSTFLHTRLRYGNLGPPLPASSSWSVAKTTGQRKSTLVEALRREAGICSIATADMCATALAYETARRLPPDHSRRQIWATPSCHRLKRPSWRSAAQVSTSQLSAELAHRAPIDSSSSCPWEDSSNWSVHADNLAPPGSQDDTTPE